jgi:predicted TIM-barrel fold metal-dependent hydrolase
LHPSVAQQEFPFCWPSVPRFIDSHVHIVSLDNNISYTWGSAPLPNMSCPCVFSSGTPCMCPWTYAAYKNASQSCSPAPSHLVFVEVAARPEQWLQEARWVQRLAHQDAVPVSAIVAGAPKGFGLLGVDDKDIAASLDEFVKLPLARGIRASSLNFSDHDAFATIVRHTAMLAARRLSLDIIAAVQTPGYSSAIARLAAAVPNATIILDHMGSPDVRHPSSFDSWELAMRDIAACENVFVKVGGLLQYFKDDGKLPSISQQAPFVLVTLRTFGFGRAMFESNWFFANWPDRMDVYSFWLSTLRSILGASASYEHLEQLFFRSAEIAYRVSAVAQWT